MLYGLYVSAAGALAQSYQQDVVANNLANADTVAFKRDLALVRARSTEAEQFGQRQITNSLLENFGGGAFALPTHTDFSTAALDQTDRPFDLALAGPGFFQVRNGNQVNYTRDGRFALDQQNQLVTYTDHLPLLDKWNRTIFLDPTLDLSINKAGQVSQNGSPVAQLVVVDFDDTTKLRKQGNNLYILQGDQQARPVQTPIEQGALESSGVNTVQEMVRMIQTQRMFQLNLRMLQVQDETLGLAVNRLGSIT